MEDVTEVIVEPEPGEDEPMPGEPGDRSAVECTASSATEDKQAAEPDSSSFVSDAACESVQMENEGAIRGGQSPPPAEPSPAARSRRSVAFFAVFDGHGGCEAAQFAREYLWEFVKKQRGFWSHCDREVCSALRKGFVACHHAMWKKLREFTHASGPKPSHSVWEPDSNIDAEREYMGGPLLQIWPCFHPNILMVCLVWPIILKKCHHCGQ